MKGKKAKGCRVCSKRESSKGGSLGARGLKEEERRGCRSKRGEAKRMGFKEVLELAKTMRLTNHPKR